MIDVNVVNAFLARKYNPYGNCDLFDHNKNKKFNCDKERNSITGFLKFIS